MLQIAASVLNATRHVTNRRCVFSSVEVEVHTVQNKKTQLSK